MEEERRMSQELPDEYPQVVPMLSYEDPGASADWLVRAFGFRERMRLTDPDGVVGHVELEFGRGVAMLGTPSATYESPRHHAEACAAARRWRSTPNVVDGVHVSVPDVDRHHKTAVEAGATILREPTDQDYGERNYVAEDPEGHRWMFAQSLTRHTAGADPGPPSDA
jgi:uncharacterized glyoxalase superfamily protein PhnB